MRVERSWGGDRAASRLARPLAPLLSSDGLVTGAGALRDTPSTDWYCNRNPRESRWSADARSLVSLSSTSLSPPYLHFHHPPPLFPFFYNNRSDLIHLSLISHSSTLTLSSLALMDLRSVLTSPSRSPRLPSLYDASESVTHTLPPPSAESAASTASERRLAVVPYVASSSSFLRDRTALADAASRSPSSRTPNSSVRLLPPPSETRQAISSQFD